MTDQTATLRWTFTDASVPETFTVPINPNEMGPTYDPREFDHTPGANGVVALFLKASKTPKEWTFGGVIRTQEHHDELTRWAAKKKKIQIGTHLGQTFEVLIQAFNPEDRQPTATVPWRMKFQMTCLVLRQVS